MALLTVAGNVFLVSLGSFVAGGTGEELVDLGGIVLLVVVALLDGLVGLCLIGVVCVNEYMRLRMGLGRRLTVEPAHCDSVVRIEDVR